MPSKNRDLKLQRKIAEQPCVVCGQEPAGTCDHILTVGAHPSLGKEIRNLWGLCWTHHREKEDRGLTHFVNKYDLSKNLIGRGFQYNDYTNKWYLPNNGDNSWL